VTLIFDPERYRTGGQAIKSQQSTMITMRRGDWRQNQGKISHFLSPVKYREGVG